MPSRVIHDLQTVRRDDECGSSFESLLKNLPIVSIEGSETESGLVSHSKYWCFGFVKQTLCNDNASVRDPGQDKEKTTNNGNGYIV